ncbi:hypothetical protein AB0D54_23925 [Streptomyces xanthophaeus]
MATVNGDVARCEECGGAACTQCEAHLAAEPDAQCTDCGLRG